MNSLLLVLCLVFAASRSFAILVEDTAGKTYMGVKLDVDVTSYRNLSIDISEIKNAIKVDPKDFAKANAIYTDGKNAKRSTGALRILKLIATAVRTNESIYTTYNASYGPNFIENFMGPTITAASVPEKVLTGLQWTLLIYVGHELDVAKNSMTTNSTVALVEINDAFGIWFGYSDTPSMYSDFRTTEKRLSCGPLLTSRVATSFKAMIAAAKASNAASFNAQYNLMFKKLFVAAYLRSVMYASGLVKRSTSWQRTASGYLRSIQPLLANQAKAKQLQNMLKCTSLATPARVQDLIKAIAKSQGISSSDVGICGRG